LCSSLKVITINEDTHYPLFYIVNVFIPKFMYDDDGDDGGERLLLLLLFVAAAPIYRKLRALLNK
jgi:hypothetical protein